MAGSEVSTPLCLGSGAGFWPVGFHLQIKADRTCDALGTTPGGATHNLRASHPPQRFIQALYERSSGDETYSRWPPATYRYHDGFWWIERIGCKKELLGPMVPKHRCGSRRRTVHRLQDPEAGRGRAIIDSCCLPSESPCPS